MTKPKPESEKLPRGRPTDYEPSMCERVVELGKEGKSRAEIASALDCSRSTLALWENTYPEFSDALTRAKDESLAWWEMKARGGIDKGSAFNSTLWAKSMSGRFPDEPYRERVQVTGANDGPLDLSKASDEQLDRLEAIVGEIAVAVGSQGGKGAPGG